MMWRWGACNIGGNMMPFGGLLSLLMLILVISVAYALLRGVAGKSRNVNLPALDALSERYAKGEIQREEYLLKRRDLGM